MVGALLRLILVPLRSACIAGALRQPGLPAPAGVDAFDFFPVACLWPDAVQAIRPRDTNLAEFGVAEDGHAIGRVVPDWRPSTREGRGVVFLVWCVVFAIAIALAPFLLGGVLENAFTRHGVFNPGPPARGEVVRCDVDSGGAHVRSVAVGDEFLAQCRVSGKKSDVEVLHGGSRSVRWGSAHSWARTGGLGRVVLLFGLLGPLQQEVGAQELALRILDQRRIQQACWVVLAGLQSQVDRPYQAGHFRDPAVVGLADEVLPSHIHHQQCVDVTTERAYCGHGPSATAVLGGAHVEVAIARIAQSNVPLRETDHWLAWAPGGKGGDLVGGGVDGRERDQQGVIVGRLRSLIGRGLHEVEAGLAFLDRGAQSLANWRAKLFALFEGGTGDCAGRLAINRRPRPVDRDFLCLPSAARAVADE